MGLYTVLLLDADGTLFDIDKAERHALRETFRLYGFEFTEKALREYRRINKELWNRLERGEVVLNTVRSQRFARLFETLQIRCDAIEFDSLYVKEQEKSAFLLDDADLVCAELCKTVPLYIVTNGIASAKHGQLARSGLLPYVNGLFISEEIGFAKPHRYFFDHVFARLDNAPRNEALIVGDSLSSDIAGGQAAGIDTCWYNPKNAPVKNALNPTYEINALIELLDIVN
jgi:2-haloacid dehalogenase